MKAMAWMVANWELISALAVFLVAVLQGVTKHFSGQVGLVWVLTRFTEIFSFIASKDSPGFLKLPFVSKAPKKYKGSGVLTGTIMGVACLIMLPACGSWQSTVKTSLDLTGVTAAESRKLVKDHYKTKCEGIAFTCAKEGDKICPPLVECQEERSGFYTALKAIHIARVAGYGAVTMGNEEDARSKAAKAVQSIGYLYKSLVVGGVL